MANSHTRLACFALGSVVCLALGCAGCGHFGAASEGEDAEEHSAKLVVKTATAEVRPVQESVAGIGRTEALPNNLVTLTPALEGHVHEIRANLGDSLHAGDMILELDSALAKADLAEKEATRAMLAAALDLLQAEPRPEDRQGLEIAIDQAVATTARAQAALDRLEPLRARKEVSEAQIYEGRQAVVQANLQQRMAESQLKLLQAGPRPEAVEEAKSRLVAADSAVALSRHRLELFSIRSPIDGVLDSLTCHPGQTIAAGSPIGEVVDTRQLNLVVWLPPHSAAEIKVGQSAQVTSGALPSAQPTIAQEKSQVHSTPNAKVASIGQVVDAQTGSLPVRILLDNPQRQVAIGQTMSVVIVTHEHVEEVVAPAAAIIDLGEGPLVVVVREGKVVQLHPSSVITHGEWTVVKGTDLKPGEPVIIEGGFKLPEGTPVEIADVEKLPEETAPAHSEEHAATPEAHP